MDEDLFGTDRLSPSPFNLIISLNLDTPSLSGQFYPWSVNPQGAGVASILRYAIWGLVELTEVLEMDRGVWKA